MVLIPREMLRWYGLDPSWDVGGCVIIFQKRLFSLDSSWEVGLILVPREKSCPGGLPRETLSYLELVIPYSPRISRCKYGIGWNPTNFSLPPSLWEDSHYYPGCGRSVNVHHVHHCPLLLYDLHDLHRIWQRCCRHRQRKSQCSNKGLINLEKSGMI